MTDIIPAHVNLIKSVTNGVGKVGFNNANIGRCMTPRRRHGPPTANLSGPFRLLSISDIISDASPATDSITVHRSNCGACKRECVASADGVRVQVVGHEGERASRRTCKAHCVRDRDLYSCSAASTALANAASLATHCVNHSLWLTCPVFQYLGCTQ